MKPLNEPQDERCELLKTLGSLSDFAREEMCGECLPCMIGTEQIVELLRKLTRGAGEERDLELLEALSAGVQETSRCRRGKRAADTLANSLLNVDAYKEHAQGKRCPSRSCSGLLHYRIIPERCTMCGRCKEACPQVAILGEEYVPYLADNEPYCIRISRCNHCGLCLPVCEAGAIQLA